MKLMKKFIPILAAVILSFSMFTASASANLHWSEGFMYVTSTGHNALVTGSSSYTTSNVTRATGYKPFNKNGATGSYTKRVGIEDSNDWIDAWANIHPTSGERGKINIAYYYKNNKIDDLTVSTAQRYAFLSSKIAGRTGSWTVAWTATQRMDWDMRITYWHYKPAYQCGPAGCHGTSEVTPQVDEKIMIAQTYNANNELKDYTVEQIGDYNFIKPSISHKNKTENKEIYNYEELYMLPYDEEIQEYVYDFAGFEAGDTILFSDSIASLEYNSKNDTTMINFQNKEDVGGWSFKGDLRNIFEVNKKITLNFEVVPFLEGTSYETINIAQEQTTPFIEKYIVE